jgi:hypothetical protein
MGNEIARVLGVFLLALNAILQIVWFTAAPLWAILIIALDIIVIIQLVMGWLRVRHDVLADEQVGAGPADA